MDKAEDICSENTAFYIFTAVKYSLFLNMHYI